MWIIPLEQLALVTHEPRTVGKEGKGREKGSTALLIAVGLRDWKDARRMCLPVLVILHTAASPSVQLIGIQSRAGSMREYWWWGGGGGEGGGAAVCLQQRSTFTARWELTGEPASETDTLSLVKWTVTLHFSTSWQHRIGRFEPCDVTLIEFWSPPPTHPSWVLKEEAGLISSVQALHAKYPGRGAHLRLGRERRSQPVSLQQSFHGCSIRPRHPSLFHCAASLLCLSASLVFLTAYSHGGLTGTWRRKTIRGSHLDPGGNPREY